VDSRLVTQKNVLSNSQVVCKRELLVYYLNRSCIAVAPLIDAGKIKLVLSQSCDKWLSSEAKRITEDALTRHKIDAIVASNDGTAAGAIAALEAKGLAGKIPISGHWIENSL
jgi:ABC-type xylose transport system substrate-binding protein